MRKMQILLTVVLSSLFTAFIIGSSILFFDRATAAPLGQVAGTATPVVEVPTYVSVSGLAFASVDPNIAYSLDVTRQILTLNSQTRNFSSGSNLFVAPLNLPDQGILTGMTVFGEDFDDQGAVTLRLKRCDHSQGRCVTVTDASSTDAFALGRFETLKIVILNEVINNNLHTYFLELELTALGNSGLRSVRLELLGKNVVVAVPGEVEQWNLTGNVTRLPLTTGLLSQVRVCTNDLSALPNVTHYPSLLVDGQVTTLSSNNCVTVWGRNVELRRSLNTGPSSGTYQILR